MSEKNGAKAPVLGLFFFRQLKQTVKNNHQLNSGELRKIKF
jgi:hypothetical protein